MYTGNTLNMTETPHFFAESRNPCFIRNIATPPTTIIFQNDMPNVVLESPSNPHISPTPPPPSSNQLHAPSCTQPCMPVFIFWIAYQSSPNSGKHMYFLKIPITHHFFRSDISNALLTPRPFFLLWLTPHKSLFDVYQNQLEHLVPLSIFTPVTRPSPYTLSRWR